MPHLTTCYQGNRGNRSYNVLHLFTVLLPTHSLFGEQNHNNLHTHFACNFAVAQHHVLNSSIHPSPKGMRKKGQLPLGSTHTIFSRILSRSHTKESTLAISALLADKSQTWEPEAHPSVIYEWNPQIKGSAIYRPEILPPSHSVIVSRWIPCLLCQKRGTLTDLLHCCHLQQVGYKNVNTIRSRIELLEVAGDLI